MSIESNVISLNERRYRPIVAAPRPKRSRSLVAKAAGSILMLGSMAFAGYALFQAQRLDALTDPFVLGTLGVLAAYFLAGGILFTRPYRRLMRSSSVATVPVAGRGHKSGSEKPGVIVQFPEPAKQVAPALMWVRCRYCRSPFQATSARDECPSCGRMAAA